MTPRPQLRDSDSNPYDGLASKVSVSRNVVKGIALLVRRFPLSVALIAVFAVFSGVIPASTAWVGKRILDDAVARLASPEPLARIEVLAFWLALGAVLTFAGIAIDWRRSVTQDWLRRAGAIEIDRILVDRTQSINVLTRESPEFLDRQMLVQMGTGALSSNLLTSVITIAQSLITMSSFAALLIAFSPGLALLGIAVGAAFGVIEMRYSRQRYALSRALIKVRRKLNVTRALLTNPYAAHEIGRPDTYDALRERMLEQGYEARDREHGLERSTHRLRAAVAGAETLISFGVYGALLWRLLAKAITVGDVILYRSAFSTLSSGVQAIGRAFSSLLESDLQLQHLFEFLEPPRDELPAANGRLHFPQTLRKGIEVRGLAFRYPNMAEPVLNDLTLDFPVGAITVVRGPNGSGKTTLLKLLSGLYGTDSDCIFLEGAPVRDYLHSEYVSGVYMWGLGSMVHPMTARENIALCRFGERADDARLKEAAVLAGAQDILDRLPDGINTMLTRMLDGGQQLSWGQSMRVVFARALFARASVLLIDEPGAGLDALARRKLLDLMRSLRDGRVIIIASHDPDVVAIADRVVDLSRPSPPAAPPDSL